MQTAWKNGSISTHYIIDTSYPPYYKKYHIVASAELILFFGKIQTGQTLHD